MLFGRLSRMTMHVPWVRRSGSRRGLLCPGTKRPPRHGLLRMMGWPWLPPEPPVPSRCLLISPRWVKSSDRGTLDKRTVPYRSFKEKPAKVLKGHMLAKILSPDNDQERSLRLTSIYKLREKRREGKRERKPDRQGFLDAYCPFLPLHLPVFFQLLRGMLGACVPTPRDTCLEIGHRGPSLLKPTSL